MHTSGSLAELLGAQLLGPADLPIDRLETIDRADDRAVTFVRSATYAASLATSRAAVAIITKGLDAPGFDTTRRALLVVPDADRALIALLQTLAPDRPHPPPGRHPTAAVDPTATVDPTASIGPGCVVAAAARVEAHAVLVASCYVGPGAAIGAHTTLHPGVVVGERCRVGQHAILHPGVKLGADGFGYVPHPSGKGLLKVPHIGAVDVHDHVEIGANTCVDRAKFGMTTIGAGTKIDNLVQIGHNCTIGRSCILCGQVGLAGSVILEDGVVLGARAGVTDNVTIGARTRVGAGSGVNADLPPNETVLGTPPLPIRQALKSYAVWKDLPTIVERLRELERAAQRQPT